MLLEVGTCHGIENYSRHISGRAPGERPAVLLDFFPKDFPVMKMAHGHDERFPICAIETGLPVLWEVIEEFCA